MIKETLGNKDLLKLKKTAFLCSRNISASNVLKCYDWAIEQRKKGNCVICGVHSKVERDVFQYLLKGKQPLIMVLARGMKSRFEPTIRKALHEERLLIITPFDNKVDWVTAKTAEKRNRLMIELADEIAIGYASKGGMLEKMLADMKGKKIYKIVES